MLSIVPTIAKLKLKVVTHKLEGRCHLLIRERPVAVKVIEIPRDPSWR